MGILKRHLGTLLVGALVVGGIAYVGARAETAPSSGVLLAQDEQEAPADGGREPDKHRLGIRRAIRGEFVVPGEEEGTFNNVKTDRGLFAGVEGTTVSIKEDDGTTVDIPTSDETRITRDREQATLSDLREGDHVIAMRVDEGNGFVTKRVRAISPEQWEKRQQRREECRENPQRCRAEFRERRAQRMPRRSEAEPLTGDASVGP